MRFRAYAPVVFLGLTLIFAAGPGWQEALGQLRQTVPESALSRLEMGKGVRISARWIQGLFAEGILQATGWDHSRVEMHAVEIKGDLDFEQRPQAFSVLPPSRVYPGQRAPVIVMFYGQDGRVSRQIRVSARADLYGYVWVLNRSMEIGDSLRQSAISRQRRNVRQIPPRTIKDPEEIIGQAARRRLIAGSVLRSDQWKSLPLIRRRQRVRILLETEVFRLEAPGESLEDAARGERIRIVNLSSRQVIVARVLDARTVQVEF
jgi:flagella basal body P-ring formation protein FlgA